ncbi:hypothetical protein P692DRAFT_20370806 [Suillus brevipes Sb2]|nr:hypothetical protein P692DRAFT_20370806 [Suillus brevipes Sb2]
MSLKIPAEIIDVDALLSDDDERADAIQFIGYGPGENSQYTNATGRIKNEPAASSSRLPPLQGPNLQLKDSHTLFTYARSGLFEVVEEVRFYFQATSLLRAHAGPPLSSGKEKKNRDGTRWRTTFEEACNKFHHRSCKRSQSTKGKTQAAVWVEGAGNHRFVGL